MASGVTGERYDVYVSCEPQDDADGWTSALIAALRAQHRAIANRDLRVFCPGCGDDNDAATAFRNARTLLAILSPAYFTNEDRRREWACSTAHEAAMNAVGDATLAVYAATVPELDDGVAGDWLDEVRARWILDLRAWREDGPEAFATGGIAPWVQRLDQEIDERLLKAARREAGRSTVPRPAQFVGRSAELEQLAALRSAIRPGAARPPALTVIHGLAGMGKTGLACEFAHVHAADYPGGRFLLPCAGVGDLTGQLIALAPRLDVALSPDELRAPAAALARIRAELVGGERRLFVLDNVDQPDLLRSNRLATWLPTDDAVHVIATTRLDVSATPEAHNLVLDPLGERDAVALLERWQPLRTDRDRAAAREIAHLLGGHPQAIEAAGLFVVRHAGVSVVAYLERLRKDVSSGYGDGDRTGVELRRVLANLLAPTLDGLSDVEARALEHAAFMAPDRVGLPWLRALVGADFPEMAAECAPGQPDPWRQAVRRLMGLGLLKPTNEPETARLHRVVQSLLRVRLGAAIDERRAATYDYVLARSQWQYDHWMDGSARWELTPIAGMARAELAEGDVERGVDLTNLAFSPLEDLGQFTAAHDLLTAAVAALETAGMQRGERYAVTCGNLAYIEEDFGHLEPARELLTRALEVGERVLSADDPSLSAMYCNLGSLETTLGRREAARDWFRRAVDRDERVCAPDDPKLAGSYGNLALAEKRLGRYEEACELVARAVVIVERAYGPDHPHLAVLVSNLASLEAELGHYINARLHMSRVLSIAERVYPSDHPQLARYYSRLASIEVGLGELDAAERRAEKAVVILQACGQAGREALIEARSVLCQVAGARTEAENGSPSSAALESARQLFAEAADLIGPDSPIARKIAAWLAKRGVQVSG